MASDRIREAGVRAIIDAAAFKNVLDDPSIVKGFFLPVERAVWENGRYTLGRGQRRNAIPRVDGVHLQEPDPENEDRSRARTCQTDLCALVRSVVQLRKTPALAGVVLSDEILVGTDAVQRELKRAIFGLSNPDHGRFLDDSNAAAECHRQIVQAAKLAGFQIENPRGFGPAAGLAELAEWTDSVRLRRRRASPLLWLLLLPPLLTALLLLFLVPFPNSNPPPPATQTIVVEPTRPAGGDARPSLFGLIVDTESLVVLIDQSAPMAPYVGDVRSETRRFLNDLADRQLRSGGTLEYFVDVVGYDTRPHPALGDIRKLNGDSLKQLHEYLDHLETRGANSDIWEGVQAAAAQAARHEKATGRKTGTACILFGNNSGVKAILNDEKRYAALMGPWRLMHVTGPKR